MSALSEPLAKELLSVDSAKRKLDFDEPCNRGMETEPFRAPIWKTKKSRRLDFGETHPSVRLRCPDFLPNRLDFDPPTMYSSGEKRTNFTADQKATLEAMFRNKKYPSRKEKATLAAKLDIGIAKVQIWFNNRRQKLKRKQKQRTVSSSRYCSIMSGASLIQTSCERSFKRTVSFGHIPQFPVQLQVPSQLLPSTPFPTAVPLASPSHHVTESYAAYSAGTQLYPQQPFPVPTPTVAVETGSLPYQQAYRSFPSPVHRIQQQQPQTNYLAEQTATSTYFAHLSQPPVNAVEPEIHHVTAADSRCLTDEFPLSYSIAKELPHIFGNREEDEVLDRPLTPSFEPPNECESLRISLAPESDQFHGNPVSLPREDFIVDVSQDSRPFNYSSCCYGSSETSSSQSRELSFGFISKGRSFRFCRQD